MPLIPLKQTVTIHPYIGLNDWGEPQYGTPYTLKCRISEGTKLVRSFAAQEVVSTAQIYFDKLVNLNPEDLIVYVDENGKERRYKPISVEVKRALNGKPIMTVVNV